MQIGDLRLREKASVQLFVSLLKIWKCHYVAGVPMHQKIFSSLFAAWDLKQHLTTCIKKCRISNNVIAHNVTSRFLWTLDRQSHLEAFMQLGPRKTSFKIADLITCRVEGTPRISGLASLFCQEGTLER